MLLTPDWTWLWSASGLMASCRARGQGDVALGCRTTLNRALAGQMPKSRCCISLLPSDGAAAPSLVFRNSATLLGKFCITPKPMSLVKRWRAETMAI